MSLSVSHYATSSCKSTFDKAVSAALLLLSSPLLITCAALIGVRHGRPIFFSQIRIGAKARPFRIWKLRTMRPEKGAPITAANDVRITSLGRVLRNWKLDELPQLWNVLKGEMSLVGPRPEVPEFVDLQAPEWSAILAVRPGLTGAASLAYPNEGVLLSNAIDPPTFYRTVLLPRKLETELAYLRNCSFLYDLSLLLRTGAFFLPRRFRKMANL